HRVASGPGFDFEASSSVLDYGAVWSVRTLAEVSAAKPSDDWYLAGSAPPKRLTLILDRDRIGEADGDHAATATVTRDGDLAREIFVTIEVDDATEATADFLVPIPAGQSSATFPVHAVDDSLADGDQIVTLVVSAPGHIPGSVQLTVGDDG